MSEDWEDEARREQQLYFSLLGDRLWDTIDPAEPTVLMRKVGYGLFGPPCELPTDVNEHTGYSVQKLQHVKKVAGRLREPFDFDEEGMQFACIHVIARIGDQNHTFPIFKAKAKESPVEACILVDFYGRVYHSWRDWLDNEKLPACTYCVPTEGVYEANSENQVKLSFQKSNALSFGSRAVNVLDGTSAVLSVGATAIGVVSLFFPIAGPILYATALTAGTAGVYGTGRSIYELVDRGRHSQSVGLADREARAHWLSVVCNSFSVGAKLAQCNFLAPIAASVGASQLTDRTRLFIFAATQIGCHSTDCIKILHACEGLVHRSEESEVDPLLIFQLTASVLFFTNNVIRFHTACSIVKELEKDTFAMLDNPTRKYYVDGLSDISSDLDESFEFVLS